MAQIIINLSHLGFEHPRYGKFDGLRADSNDLFTSVEFVQTTPSGKRYDITVTQFARTASWKAVRHADGSGAWPTYKITGFLKDLVE